MNYYPSSVNNFNQIINEILYNDVKQEKSA